MVNDDQIKAVQKLNHDLQKLDTIKDWFGNDIRGKTDVTETERTYISYVRGYSGLIGGLPGVDEMLDQYDVYGRSLNRRSSLEFVESIKTAVTNLIPNMHQGTTPASNDAQRDDKVSKVRRFLRI
jgi:hypothetical protein